MLSVIIPTYNRNDLLNKCLQCLDPAVQIINASKYEVIVTDDSNHEEAKQFIQDNFSWVTWVAGKQKGPAANRNNGAKEASGEWLIFIDDDCQPNQHLLQNYHNALLSNQNTLVFEGCIKADRAQQSFAEESPVNENGGYLWSCNFMINKKLFLDTLQGFDEQFPFAAMEDVELNYRLNQLNIKKTFVKEAFVVHPWRTQKNMWKITLNRFESTLYFLKKHPEKKKEINSRYYLIAFYNSLVKNTLKNAVKFGFRGFYDKIIYDLLQLYFSFYTLIRKY
ncbi:MAG: glycosyltransferase family 2 protein [Janthinobacterium lividum]